MKWPNSVTVVRHGESRYNALKGLKSEDPLYAEFKRAYNRRKKDPDRARALAIELYESGSFSLAMGDHDTPLTEEGIHQARLTARELARTVEAPDVIFVSPYLRTRETLDCFTTGWPELDGIPEVEDERLREQEHGLSLLYADWRMFQIMHPEQEQLRQKQGRIGTGTPRVRMFLIFGSESVHGSDPSVVTTVRRTSLQSLTIYRS